MREEVWIVEAAWEIRGRRLPWRPVMGLALDRAQGRKTLADWRRRNPDDRFRLARYARRGPK